LRWYRLVGYFGDARPDFRRPALSHIDCWRDGDGLVGLARLAGLLARARAAGSVMGSLSERISNRDVAIGVVLALALGFGLLFLHYYTSFATQATALLFGNVLAVDHAMIAILAVLGVINARSARRHDAAPDLRQPAARIGGSQRRAAALRLHRILAIVAPRYRHAHRLSACCWYSR
jgi:hypothetical protein